MSNLEKMTDPNAIAELRKASPGKRLRIDGVAKFFGITKEQLEGFKGDKKMMKRYKDALDQSLSICKGKTIHEEFLERIEEWKDNDEWNYLDVIGYFCYVYERVNGVDFIFNNCKNPFKTKDAKMAANVVSVLKDRETISKYIDWAFEVKQRGGFNIFGMSVLSSGWLLNEFNVYMRKSRKITRTTKLPEKFIKWCKDNVSQIFEDNELDTYGHLNTLIGMTKSGGADECVFAVVNKAREMGVIKKRNFKND